MKTVKMRDRVEWRRVIKALRNITSTDTPMLVFGYRQVCQNTFAMAKTSSPLKMPEVAPWHGLTWSPEHEAIVAKALRDLAVPVHIETVGTIRDGKLESFQVFK